MGDDLICTNCGQTYLEHGSPNHEDRMCWGCWKDGNIEQYGHWWQSVPQQEPPIQSTETSVQSIIKAHLSPEQYEGFVLGNAIRLSLQAAFGLKDAQLGDYLACCRQISPIRSQL